MPNVRDIFFEAMDVPLELRQAFLDQACGGDTVLRSEVDELLNKWQAAGTFMEAPAVPRDDLQTPDLRGDPTQKGDPSNSPELTITGSPTWPGRKLPAEGTTFPMVPGYEIQAELGRGGMGVVYAARQVAADRIVALKTIRPGQDGPTRERFRREAKAAAVLRHTGVIEIFEVGEAAAGPYFSMEYCPDGNLDEYLRGRPLGGEEASRLVSSLARAVAAAHDLGLLHRDIKPGNVMLAASRLSHETEEGAAEERRPLAYFLPKLTDFGLAKRVGDDKLTQTGMLMGTPSYMSPEQASGEPDLGPASDVYALGAVLYECLTGRPPFLAATPMLTLAMVIDQEAVPPRRLRPDLPKDLETICLKCLEKNPDRRYVIAGELADDLDRFLAGRPITARPAGTAERAYKWVKRNRMLTGSAAAVVLSLALGLGGAASFALDAIRERDLKDAAMRAEKRQLGRAEAIKDFLLEDLIGLGDVSRRMTMLGPGGGQATLAPDPRVSDLLKRVAVSLTESRLEERFRGQPLVQADVLFSVGQVSAAVGEFHQAAALLDRAEQRYTQHAGTGPGTHSPAVIC